jgi:HEAT repeat protein
MKRNMITAALALAVGVLPAAAQTISGSVGGTIIGTISGPIGGVALGSLPSISSLGSLESLSSLSSLASLSSLGSLESLGAELGAMGVELGAMGAELGSHGVELGMHSAELGMRGAELGMKHLRMDRLGFEGLNIYFEDSKSSRRSSLPPEAWAQGDPADSLYRAARKAMVDGSYKQAATLYERIADRYPRSKYVPDALYYRAYSLSRTGNTEDLQAARRSLATLASRFPESENKSDAGALDQRICGQLAERGDAKCAEETTKRASESAKPSSARNATRSGSCPDEDDDERVAALQALMNMSSEQAMPILKKVIERRDECSTTLRRKAVWLISQKRSDDVADVLLKAAKDDPDREVREQAVFWMSQVRDPRVIELLADLLKSSKDEGIKDKAIFALSQVRSDRAAQILRDLALNEDESSELRDKAIWWLGQQKSQANADFLKTIYAKLKNRELKDKLLFSLGQMRGYNNDQWLLDVAADEKEDTELRKKAIFSAGQGGASIDQLIGLYGKLQDREMREQLIFTYSQRREKSAVDKLLDIAKNEKDSELRKKAIFWLSQSRDPRVAQFLMELIDR